ncbi:MAG: radical SAM protein [Candidatus Micrarchaeaceae archaeon]
MSVEKMLGLGMTALESNFRTLKRPYKLNFAVTYWCQSRCLTCNIWQMKPKGELSIDEIQEFAKKNDYFKWIELTGGEVFMRGDIVEIARAFKESSKHLYILTMPTNSLSNHELMFRKLEEILALGIPRIAITVSLDGYRELHDRIRGVPGNYDKAIDTFKRLIELKKEHKNLYFVFGYTMSKFNQGMFDETVNAVKRDIPSITYNDFHINLGQISDNYYGNSGLDIKPNDSEVMRELSHAINARKKEYGAISLIEAAFLKNLVEYARTGKTPMKSKSLEASLFLDSYGNVYPSIMWNRKIGNIRDTAYSLNPLWENSEARAVRKLIREGKEPSQWTSCEAYQSIMGKISSLIG